MTRDFPQTLGELKGSPYAQAQKGGRSVKDEMRANLQAMLRGSDTIFPGIVGYDETVVPQIVNAILSRHNMILLGLRGQAKSRILRSLVRLLDEWIPAVAGCEIHDSPYGPICTSCRQRLAEMGDALPLRFLHRDERYVEKLATPDVTIADMIGDVDPIRAARGGLDLSDELTIHYGLLPRANRGIFAINELPDLAGKIQVGLFNILQEGDVQIKGYPIRLPLDVAMVFSANPEDYTARGKIITPLKDRIGSEIRTHYPATIEDGMAITHQEAWTNRGDEMLLPHTEVRRRDRRGGRVQRQERPEGRQAQRRKPAPLDHLPGEHRLQRRAARPGAPGEMRRAAGRRHLLGDPLAHRQVRARVRGGTARRRQHREGPDPGGRGGGVPALQRGGRLPARHRLVRSRRHPADRAATPPPPSARITSGRSRGCWTRPTRCWDRANTPGRSASRPRSSSSRACTPSRRSTGPRTVCSTPRRSAHARPYFEDAGENRKKWN